MIACRGKTVDRIPGDDAVVSDEVALLGLGVCNFISTRLAVLFLAMRTNESSRCEQEINGWAERRIVEVRRIDMDLGKAEYVLEIRFPRMGRRGKVDDPVMMPS